MIDQPSPELMAMLADEPAPSEDRLVKLRQAVAKVRDLEQRKADLEASLKETNVALQDQYFNELPALFDEVGVSEIQIAAEGNNPAVKATAAPYYHANIAAEWPEERRDAAFSYLEENGDGGLIKTEFTITFGLREREKAKIFAKRLEQAGLGFSMKRSVPWSTLTAWLKEQVEKHDYVPPLDTIGGRIGRIVKLKAKS